ncbi:MBL fold metallo-hydrolase [Brevibacillus fluminis]|uniref:MBL fold metallo-hydrolase n=1 Tax=Brevibacillus fluminis TaxID=511487 RepID=A0A3M8DU94_9BACL|nr:MBL fold metallo-hydrolase [Brevibacillus fluminis]RNB90537.1 MBL fold metallo-hydrolase [Brevibacillus fluminis]
MKIQLIRHATLLIEYKGRTLLLDPMLSEQGAMPPVVNTANAVNNPRVSLPFAIAPLLEKLDGIIVTHLHGDHLDQAAIAQLPKGLPLFCQPEDQNVLRGHGFTQVIPVDRELTWESIRLTRTGGQHGTGEIGAKMGPVSGFVLAAQDEPTLYVAGDTIWCEEVADALAAHTPAVVAVNSGAAQFLVGDPITMTAADVVEVCRHAPQATVLPVHLEVWNHCFLTRSQLAEALEVEGLGKQAVILADGEDYVHTDSKLD